MIVLCVAWLRRTWPDRRLRAGLLPESNLPGQRTSSTWYVDRCSRITCTCLIKTWQTFHFNLSTLANFPSKELNFLWAQLYWFCRTPTDKTNKDRKYHNSQSLPWQYVVVESIWSCLGNFDEPYVFTWFVVRSAKVPLHCTVVLARTS